MSSVFFILMMLTMAAVLGALVLGILSMAKGGEFNRKYGNKLMRTRVFLQAGALLCFAIAMIAFKK
ncbi:MAG: twin transmembrane helix small protein [Alphaproteobacteria bacterium]